MKDIQARSNTQMERAQPTAEKIHLPHPLLAKEGSEGR